MVLAGIIASEQVERVARIDVPGGAVQCGYGSVGEAEGRLAGQRDTIEGIAVVQA